MPFAIAVVIGSCLRHDCCDQILVRHRGRRRLLPLHAAGLCDGSCDKVPLWLLSTGQFRHGTVSRVRLRSVISAWSVCASSPDSTVSVTCTACAAPPVPSHRATNALSLPIIRRTRALACCSTACAAASVTNWLNGTTL